MTSALVGHSGFVGSSLKRQADFDDLYNSSNIQDIRGKRYDLVICAAAPAAKWKANQEPEADLANLNVLMDCLKAIEAEAFILISTIDVYKIPVEVDEDTEVSTDDLHAYGKHRFFLENFVREHFPQAIVARLPGLFGEGLKKNFIFDLIHRGSSEWTHHQSTFQFYNMANLWRDLQTVRQQDIRLINFATEPVQAGDVARESFDMTFTYETENPPVHYDMRSKQAHIFGSGTPYMLSAQAVFDQIRAFAVAAKAKL